MRVLSALVLAASLRAANVNFEDLNGLDVVGSHYAGVVFTNAKVLSAGITLNEFDFPARSGNRVIFDDAGPMTLSFPTPISNFTAYLTYTTRVTVIAYDQSGKILASVVTKYVNNSKTVGVSGSSPNEKVSLIAPSVARIVIAGGTQGESIACDDISFAAVAADLTVFSTHSGNFTPGTTANTFMTWVSNVGAGPTSGKVDLKSTLLPPGQHITATSIGGSGWTCSLSTLVCSRSDSLLPGSNYPPVVLSAKILDFTSVSTFEQTATISGGGQANLGNDLAKDAAVSFATGGQSVPITVTTIPVGLRITVDGGTSIAPRTFYWRPGQAHSISIASPQASPFPIEGQYIFSRWADGGPRDGNVVAPDIPTAFIAAMAGSQ